MTGKKEIEYARFSPTKRFFVDMFTRDIALNDAIMDLLDNCVDGIANVKQGKVVDCYKGFSANISFDKDQFTITDNCGGIPKEDIDYAFRMGRPEGHDKPSNHSIGVYGIGMKRAIFKMGKTAEIKSQFDAGQAFAVNITPSWLEDDTDWKIPIDFQLGFATENGTRITVKKLKKEVSKEFSSRAFETGLIKAIRDSYSYIISKGFKVYVNNKEVKENKLFLKFDLEKNIAPYIYKADIDGVNVELAIGFYRETPSEDEISDALQSGKRKSEDAGITIICNDRVVVSNDRTELTGWGSGAPRYHTQFIAISGVVHFKSDNPDKLPITTTKRGVDANSSIYLHVRDMMIEGIKVFTKYTNQWKNTHLREGRKKLEEVVNTIELSDIKHLEIAPKDWTKVRNKQNELKYVPNLPEPAVSKKEAWIKFKKEVKDIEFLCSYLYGEEEDASKLGSDLFDKALMEAKE